MLNLRVLDPAYRAHEDAASFSFYFTTCAVMLSVAVFLDDKKMTSLFSFMSFSLLCFGCSQVRNLFQDERVRNAYRNGLIDGVKPGIYAGLGLSVLYQTASFFYGRNNADLNIHENKNDQDILNHLLPD